MFGNNPIDVVKTRMQVCTVMEKREFTQVMIVVAERIREAFVNSVATQLLNGDHVLLMNFKRVNLSRTIILAAVCDSKEFRFAGPIFTLSREICL